VLSYSLSFLSEQSERHWRNQTQQLAFDHVKKGGQKLALKAVL
jgi:hypothetical protein